MAKITQLTSHSWIIKNNTNRDYTGILYDNGDGFIFMSPSKQLNFSSMEEVTKKFGKLKEEARDIVIDNENINGYPVKHHGIVKRSDDPPLYTKGESKTQFAAGYWGVEFQHGWTLAYCPKYSTCEQYQHVGPFRNRLEALNNISSLNSRRINETN